MKLTRISITNLLGIEALETTIHPEGAIATGGNAAGKTSFIKAVRAALEAAGVDSSAIRIGADKSEIILDTDAAVKIRRGITSSGSSLTVTNKDGDKWARPQTRLTELVGATLDPLAFYLATPDERRKQILAAMPVTVTSDDLKRWTGEDWDVKEGRHGLEVIAEVRRGYYEARTEANRAVKAAEVAHKAASEEVAKFDQSLLTAEVTSEALAHEAVRAAERARNELTQRQRQSERQAEQSKGTLDRIAALRAEAKEIELSAGEEPPSGEIQKINAEVRVRIAEVEELERQLAEKRFMLDDARARAAAWHKRVDDYGKACVLGESKLTQAEALEATLAETRIDPPTAEEIAAADASIESAVADLERVRSVSASKAAAENARRLESMANKAKDEAARLDAIVQTLTADAPAEVAKRSQSIPGLSFGEKGITLDGKAIDNLSGAEQLRFAVDLAKRASKAKILVVDGLERLDKTRLREFVSYATSGGFQLLATLVTDGPLHIVEPSRITIVGPDEADAQP